MHGLTQRDYRASLQFVADVCSERDAATFCATVVSGLARLISSDVVSFNLAGPTGLFAVDEPAGTCTPALRELLVQLIGQHPLLSGGFASDDERAYRLSDFRSQREFATTELYNDFYRKIGLRYELSFTMRRAKNSSLTIGLDRTSRDYSDRDLELLRSVSPHIVTAQRRLWELEALRKDGNAMVLDHLTPRERDVLTAAAGGKTNGQIGASLGISPRTAQKHLENVFRKLAVERRAAAAAAFARAATAAEASEFNSN